MVRVYELFEIPGSSDAFAFGAARLALEVRLEQILEEMMKAGGDRGSAALPEPTVGAAHG
jgi:hypothetical protein